MKSNGFVFQFDEKEGASSMRPPQGNLLTLRLGVSARSPTAAGCKTTEDQQGKRGCGRLGNKHRFHLCWRQDSRIQNNVGIIRCIDPIV